MSAPVFADPASAEAWLEIVRRKVEAMRFGTVQIIVHEGRVTQVESTEKTRLTTDKPPAAAPPARSEALTAPPNNPP